METKPLYQTHGKIMHRVPKTDANIYGARRVKSIPTNRLSIVIFGGERTNKIKMSNGYAAIYERLLDFYKISGVHIYSAYYDFELTNRNTERANAFIAARSKILNRGIATKPVDTQYIDDLYQIVIRPRIADKNGNKLPTMAALKNTRNLIIGTHCHGSVPVFAFQSMMAEDMRELGYTTLAIHEIMKNLLVIQHAPVSPLEKSRFNTVSFMSANDTRMNFKNKFSDYVIEHDGDLSAAYFQLGNFFATNGFTYQYLDEHSITGLVPSENQDMLTPDGAIIMAAERNAIINGILAAQHGVAIPDVSELVAPISTKDAVKPDFEALAQNGEFFMNLMQHDLRTEKSKER